MKKFVSMTALIALCTAALSSAQAAEVRLANLASNTRNVDVWVGDKKIASDIGSESASSFMEVGSGTQKVMVTEAGTVYPLGTLDLNLDGSSQYTVVLEGDMNTQTQLTPFKTEAVNPLSGQVAVRVFNLSAVSPSLDVSGAGTLFENTAKAMTMSASSSTFDVSFAGSSVGLTSVTPALDSNTDVFVIDQGYTGNFPNLRTVTIAE